MKDNWLISALRCCGGPALFYSLLFTGLGGLFLILSVPMPVVLVLFCAGLVSFLSFAFLAYGAHKRGDRFAGCS